MSPQSSLVDGEMNLRPGMTVHETRVLEEDGADDREADPSLVRSRAGPSESQVPGRLSRSTYKVNNCGVRWRRFYISYRLN